MLNRSLCYILPILAAALFSSGTKKRPSPSELIWLEDTFEDAIVDHFDPESRKFSQRFCVGLGTYTREKPLVFLFVGADQPMSPSLIPVNLMRLASSFKAAVAYLEHRYFGGSFPTEDVSAKTLKDLLTIPQTVEDIRTFGEYLKRYLNSPTLQIVLFGDSYGGSLAAWVRGRYTRLFIGAVSSSAVFDIKLDNDLYASIEAQGLSNKQLGGSPKCLETVKKAHKSFANLTKSSDGRRKLEKKFNACKNILDDRMNQLALEDYCNIKKVCRRLTKTNDDPLDAIADIFLTKTELPPNPPGCFSDTFADYIKMLEDPDNQNRERMSRFIFCRGFGQRQPCTDENNCPWLRTEERLELNVRICGAFGISEEQAKEYIDQVQTEYGGKTLKGATNIFSINGEADPWRSVSITEPAEGIDVYTVPLASH
ncbi:Thymus-specific serine protease [Perkinsus chesapeaki]|uniref:Thymus-specific serine protease n=1 Tax=Perkinsus chesapeaki TaxID=330153 RepID=A0A7J6LN41_PERCH|nr:Thymus-specific serine protease [Perkinsus chesapeaki]